MPLPLATGDPPRSGPTFQVIERKPPRPAAILLAAVLAAAALSAVAFGLGHSRARHFADGDPTATRSPGSTSGGATTADKDDKDDPSQVDTIVLGDAADAPVPARKGGHVSDVHATILIRLPRYGDQVGLIPDSPAGHLLFGWLAAFNQASYPALQKVLPNAATASTAAAQMEMRQQTGGFNLLSAREIQPGVLVFRLRDQTPTATEVLGTLHVRPNSSPAAIASFSLRAVLPADQNAIPGAPASPR
jgi:hypothetical protein